MKKPPRRSAGAAGQARSPTWETCREAVRLPAPFVLQYNPLSAYLFHALPRVALAGFFLPQIFGLGRVHYVEFFRLMRGAFVLSLPILRRGRWVAGLPVSVGRSRVITVTSCRANLQEAELFLTCKCPSKHKYPCSSGQILLCLQHPPKLEGHGKGNARGGLRQDESDRPGDDELPGPGMQPLGGQSHADGGHDARHGKGHHEGDEDLGDYQGSFIHRSSQATGRAERVETRTRQHHPQVAPRVRGKHD